MKSMCSAWFNNSAVLMGGLWSKVGSDPYYASYERSFERLKAESDKLKDSIQARRKRSSSFDQTILFYGAIGCALTIARAAWVVRQPAGTYTAQEHALGVAPMFLEPVAVYLLYKYLHFFLDWRLLRDERRLRGLEKKMREMVHELKDSTRYDRTQTLLSKYDPDYVPPTPPPQLAKRRGLMTSPRRTRPPFAALQQQDQPLTPSRMGLGSLAGAGMRLLPALDKLANQIVGDPPVLMEGLREAKSEAEALKARLEAREARIAELEAQNLRLRARLGSSGDAEGPSDDQEGRGLFGSHLSGPMSPRMLESPAGESPHATGEKGWELLARMDDPAAKAEAVAGVHIQPDGGSRQLQDKKVESHSGER